MSVDAWQRHREELLTDQERKLLEEDYWRDGPRGPSPNPYKKGQMIQQGDMWRLPNPDEQVILDKLSAALSTPE